MGTDESGGDDDDDDDDSDGQTGGDPDYGRCAWTVFSGDHKLCASIAENAPWNDQQVDRVAGYVTLIRQLLGGFSAACVRGARADLRRYNQQWERYALGGYTQFPWEYLVNSAIRAGYLKHHVNDKNASNRWQPLGAQLILAHPGVGIGLDGASKVDDDEPKRRTVAVLTLEVVGGIGYFKDFKWYFGGSILLSANNVDLTLPSVGLAVHLFRYISVGYSLGVVKDNLARGTAFVLFDVGSLISDDEKIKKVAVGAMDQFKASTGIEE